MERSIFGFIWRYSKRQQLGILFLAVLLMPVGYAIFEIPKRIINQALGEDPAPVLFGWTWTQLDLLYALCAMFLGIVLVQGALKYTLNVYAGVVAERELRRLRYQLYNHVLRFPLSQFKRVSQGELVQMINAEVEPLGNFIAGAARTPGLAGGQLITSLFFMFMQDPILGLAAIALYPLQIWLIPKLQAKVNALNKDRVRQVRRNADKIAEISGGVRDIRGNDVSLYESSRFSRELEKVFRLRLRIYILKFLIKFLNNFIAQLGPFFFYAIGGYLVLQGDVTIGALVAVIGAQQAIASPWKELLAFYQLTYDVKIKYDQVILQFLPQDLRNQSLMEADPPSDTPAFKKQLRLNHVGLTGDDDDAVLEGVSASIELPSSVAVVGPSGSSREELLLCMCNLLQPTSGNVQFDGTDINSLPDSVAGREIAFVANPANLFSGSVRDNLLFGVKYRPVVERDPSGDRAAFLIEAARSGNCELFPEDEWIDRETLGLEESEPYLARMIEALHISCLDQDVYAMGLRNTLDAKGDDDLVQQLLGARHALQERLRQNEKLSRLVEQFEPSQYNENASIAENLLFGTPLGDTFDLDHLADHPHLRSVLEKTGLTAELLSVGYELASTMVELFADLPPDHEYFRQFSFIEADDLPDYKALISRTDAENVGQLPEADRRRLLDLPFKLIPARHRIGLIDDGLKEKILEARQVFRETLPTELASSIEFFDPSRWNHAATIQDNLLFGKIVYGQAQASERVAAFSSDLLKEMSLTERVIEVGMRTPCGTSGSRLSAPQRQKLAIARAIIKKPQVILLSDATGALDNSEARLVRDAILSHFEGRTVVWAPRDSGWAEVFDHVLVMERGRLVESGSYNQLSEKDGALSRLLKTG